MVRKGRSIRRVLQEQVKMELPQMRIRIAENGMAREIFEPEI